LLPPGANPRHDTFGSMRVLITGASGQVGSATAQRLESRATVIATDRAALDLSKPDAIPGVLDEIAPDLVINTAAYTAVDRAEEEPALAQLVNAEAPGAIARWCARRNVSLIHLSTDYVFDGRGTQPWSEDDPPHPLSAYGASKLAGEEQIRAARGCFLIIRASWIYAARGMNFLRKIAAIARTHKELRIVADQFGAPTPAALIAEILCTMLENGLPMFRKKAGDASGIVHLAASGEASWYEFATLTVDGLRSRGVSLTVDHITPIRTEEYPLPAQRPLNSRFNLHRLQTVFGITPPHWREVLSSELDQLARDLS
jgi:dTDP-4-dehydrorhamnose reductase